MHYRIGSNQHRNTSFFIVVLSVRLLLFKAFDQQQNSAKLACVYLRSVTELVQYLSSNLILIRKCLLDAFF